jgi:hypothetical protein
VAKYIAIAKWALFKSLLAGRIGLRITSAVDDIAKQLHDSKASWTMLFKT